MAEQKSFDVGKYLSDYDERIDEIRDSHPEMGRLRLALIVITNWPALLFTFLNYGNRIIRFGYGLPTFMIVYSVAAGHFLGRNNTLDYVLFWIAVILLAAASWGVFGVVSVVFNVPLSESILSRVERLAMGKGKNVNGGKICLEYAEEAKRDGREDDWRFFMEAREKIMAMERIDAEWKEHIQKNINRFRREYAANQALIKSECMVKCFSNTLMTFVGAIFIFAFISRALSLLDHSHFDPAGPMSFFTAFYFSFTTITTTDYGDITPHNNLSRFFSVWEQCVGVAFMTVVIGAVIEMSRRSSAPEDGPPKTPWSERKIRRRVIAFALALFRDYQELSEPRRQIDALLDGVGEHMEKSRAKIKNHKTKPPSA
jgi:ABC-type multidrug transport system fused ATPase/permease subunit